MSAFLICFVIISFTSHMAFAQKYRYTVFEEKNEIRNIKISNDSKYLAYVTQKYIAANNRQIKILDLTNVNIVLSIEANITAFDISPDSKYLLFKTDDGTCNLYEITSSKNMGTWKSDEHCSNIQFSNDGCFYIELYPFFGINGPLKLIDFYTKNEVFSFNYEHNGVSNAHFSDDGAKIYCGTNGFIYIINAVNGQLIYGLPLDQKNEWYHDKLDCYMIYNETLDKIYSSNRQKTDIIVINPHSGHIEKKISTDNYRLGVHFSLSPDNKYMAYSVNKIIYIRNLETDEYEPILNIGKKMPEFKISSNFSYGIGYVDNQIYVVDLTKFSIDSKLYCENYYLLNKELCDIYKSIIPRNNNDTTEEYQERLSIINKDISEKKQSYIKLIEEKKKNIQ